MNEKRLYVRKRTDKLSDHIEKKMDPWSLASKRKLKRAMANKVKRTFVCILEALDKEKSDGTLSADVHKRLRAKVLNIGNDQIRNAEMEIEDRYNVEALNYHIKLRVMSPEEFLNEG